ncbi:uncharacterized protein [Dermacentor albipictus]|uniref:uncharacterized protein isoform X3 n=1 Tax=Dermacentor albipictus TaxID=60249 RepID=UPI0031FBCCF6
MRLRPDPVAKSRNSPAVTTIPEATGIESIEVYEAISALENPLRGVCILNAVVRTCVRMLFHVGNIGLQRPHHGRKSSSAWRCFSSLFAAGAPEAQTSETALEDLLTRDSSRMLHPMLHLAFGCTCLLGLVVAFAVGIVLLIVKAARARPPNVTEASGVIDKYSINLVSTPGEQELREAADKSDYAWPFEKLINLTANG